MKNIIIKNKLEYEINKIKGLVVSKNLKSNDNHFVLVMYCDNLETLENYFMSEIESYKNAPDCLPYYRVYLINNDNYIYYIPNMRRLRRIMLNIMKKNNKN